MAKLARKKEIVKEIDFSADIVHREDFENCEFINCVFTDLSNLNFRDCDFTNCNLSNLKTLNSRMQNVSFFDCKLLGLNFSGAIDFAFELHFENCILDYASFDKKKLNKSSFKNCKIHSANFTQADLSKCTITNCDFYESLFANTNLSTVDFTTNKNFLIDPEINTIKKTKFLAQDLANLLYRYDIIIE
ncbi:MAG: pentapeptide repeat-containing protein [Bacteroidota bacterium]|nr:pentapeptide repeat-containing protein [Bacteroidota bacterium]MDP3144385.1 pentapeptide repeat-containing protein [Bacteroidota bacterium]